MSVRPPVTPKGPVRREPHEENSPRIRRCPRLLVPPPRRRGSPPRALAVVTWDGGGGTTNWSDAFNWTGDILPTSIDVATFDITSNKVCTIDTLVDVQGIDIQGTYTGTISQGANKVIVGSGDFSQAGGTFTGGTDRIDVKADFTVSGGTFTSTSDQLQVAGAFSHTGGTFAHNGGQVILAATVNQTLTLSGGTTFNDIILGNGIFGYWKLDETAPPSVDSSGSGSDGAWPNGATSSTDVAPVTFANPRSLQFDGVNQYAQVVRTSILEPGDTFTVMCWMKRKGAVNQGVRLSAMFRKSWMGNTAPTWGSYSLQLPMADYSQAAFGTGHAASVHDLYSLTGTIPDLTWVHVCGVYDPNGPAPQKRIYINGALNNSVTHTLPIEYDTTSPSGDFFIGSPSIASGEFFDGWIDDLRLYSRALSDAEILQLAQGQMGSSSAATTTVAGGVLNISGSLSVSAGTLNDGGQNITVAAALNIGQAELVQTTGTLSADSITVLAGGTWRNESTGDIVVGTGGVTNSGTIILDGGGGGCGSPAGTDDIVITSSVATTQRAWDGTGTFQIEDVTVTDQAGTATIQVYHSTDGGNNGANWIFIATCPVPPVAGGKSSSGDDGCSCGSVSGELTGVSWIGLVALLLLLALAVRR